MKEKLTITGILGLSAIAIVCIVPPWETDKLFIGYYPIWTSPNVETASIDSERLLVQIFAAMVLSTILFLVPTVLKKSHAKALGGAIIAPAMQKLDENRKLIVLIMLITFACTVAVTIVVLRQKIREAEKQKIAMVAEFELEKKLSEQKEKDDRIAALMRRDEQSKFAREQKELAKPKNWPIIMKERKIRGTAYTNWVDGYMNVGLELRATPEVIELAEARQEAMDIFFQDKNSGFNVHVPVPPGSLTVQKDSAGAWSRLVLGSGHRVSTTDKEYRSLNSIRVFYVNRETR